MKLSLFNQNEEFYMYSTTRYQLTILNKRTTIPINEIISDLIAIKLGFSSVTKDTHVAVRKQIEKLILPYYDPKSPCYNLYCINNKLTQVITNEAILWLAEKELTRKYYEYKIKGYGKIK